LNSSIAIEIFLPYITTFLGMGLRKERPKIALLVTLGKKVFSSLQKVYCSNHQAQSYEELFIGKKSPFEA